MNTGKQINIMVALLFLTLIVFGAYTIWDPIRADEAAEFQDRLTAERGAIIFAQNCRLCHGDRGEGGAAGGRLPQAVPMDRPDLQGRPGAGEPVDPLALKEAEKLIKDTISCGRVGTAMPTWSDENGGPLNDEQIRQLTVLITSGEWHLAQEWAEHADATGVRLGEDVSAATTELRLDGPVSGFQAPNPIRIGEERMLISEVRRPVLVVQRAQAGTQAAEHAAGTAIEGTDSSLAEAVSASAAEIPVDSAAGLQAGRTIAVGGEEMAVREIREGALIVERGVLATEPAAHSAGSEVFNQPPPPQNPTIVQAICGQRALVAIPTAAPPTPTAGAGTPAATPEATATATPPPSGVQEVTIKAVVGIKWDIEEIRVKPGPVIVHFINEDIGVPHNFAVYTDDSASEAIVGQNQDICTGPCSVDISFEITETGTYFFRCDVHPQVMTGDFIVEE